MAAQLISIMVLLPLCSSAVSISPPCVSIGAGTVNGGICDGDPNAKYFKSIPYAQPPVGNLRFAPPQPYSGNYSGGALNGTANAPTCVQFGDIFAENPPYTEDCLYLDVWAPQYANAGSVLPVKVWIYGGSDTAGGISDSFYDGCAVADAGALLVSINYRLGPLGFLALETAGIPGNQGISDILMGLQWVQDNIAAFGGDPLMNLDLKKVLLHGQSAGAIDVFTIASLPQAPQLMNAAVMQSGGGRDLPLNATAQTLGSSFAQALNCSVTTRQCFSGKSVDDIRNAYNTVPLLNSKTFPMLKVGTVLSYVFEPYIDGQVVPKQPWQEGAKVPSIFGSTSMDGALFAFLQFVKAPKSLGSANASDYHTFLTENFGPAASLIEHNYPVSAFNSTSMPAFYAISAVLGEANYICTARRALNTTSAAGVPVWAYNFAHVPNCSWLPGVPQNVVPLLGPTHTAEIPFVFGHTVQHPTSNSSCNMTQAERTISRFMMDAWTSMAVNQKPTMNSSYWPPYKDAKQSLGMNIVNASVPGYIDYASCALWDEVNQILENDSNHNTTTASNSTATIKGAISGQVGSGVMVYGIVLLATAMFVIF